MGNALMGHALVDLVGAGIVALLLLAAERFRLTPHAIVWDNMWLGILCGWAVMFVVATFIERAFVVTRKHDDPGSWLKTILITAVAIPAGLACQYFAALPGKTWAVLVLGSHVIAYGIEHVAILQQWRDGMPRAEVRDAWEKTKDLTRDTFSD